jgi:hypothetical protein
MIFGTLFDIFYFETGGRGTYGSFSVCLTVCFGFVQLKSGFSPACDR